MALTGTQAHCATQLATSPFLLPLSPPRGLRLLTVNLHLTSKWKGKYSLL